MPNRLNNLLWILLSLVWISRDGYASHMMGADLSYVCLGGNQYRIVLNVYRDCSGISVNASYTVTVSSASCGVTQTLTLSQVGAGTEVSPLCASQLPFSSCNGGTLPGVEQYVYDGTITLPQSCADWIISTTDINFCCRNSSITNLINPDFEDLHLRAELNNTGGICNNSPVFTTLPVPYICNGQLINYNHGTVDIDGDSLVYTLTNPLTINGAPIGYVGGYSPTNPMTTTSGFQFNGQTGQMTFTPSGIQVAVVAVLVREYRNGMLIGSVMRDIQVVVLNCTNNLPQASAPTNIIGGQWVNNRIEVCPGTNVNFQFTITDANPTDILSATDNVGISIPGATLTYSNGAGNSLIGNFSWTPSAADTGINVFVVTAEDNACPTIGINTFSYSIFVLRGTTAGPDQTYCSAAGALQLNAVGGSQFTWSPPQGLSCTNCPNPLASPTVTTTYIVQSNLSSQCKNRDTITVFVAPNFNFDAGPNATICMNALHQMSPMLDQSGAPYTFQWTPSAGLSATNIANPLASPTVTTTYRLRVTSAQGCTLVDSVTITVSGVAPSVSAFADPDTVCPGGATQLTVSAAPRTCGIAYSPCLNGNTPYTLGTGTSTTTDGTPYDGFWHDGRVQILYRASELTALGMSAGTINSIAWNVANKGSTIPYNGFTIKMGCTSLNSLSGGFLSGLTTVLGPITYSTVLGWNVHTLATGYEWDGVSNLIVEICYDNTAYTLADAVQQTPTSYNSVLYRNVDNAVGCNLTNPTATTTRPNTRFGLCVQTLQGSTITWTSTPAAIIQSPNSETTQATVSATTTFVVNVSRSGCVGQAFATVVTDNSLSISAGPDTALCNPTSIQLYAQAIGTPGPIQLSCGANGRPCNAATANIYTIGNNSGVTSTTTPFRGQEQEARIQILLRSNELTAAGFSAGIISSIAFNVTSKNSTVAFNQFTVRIGCTNLTSLSGTFVTGLTQVFNPKPVTTVSGWNTLNFDNTFDWSGLSNLIIEVCFTNTGNNNNDIISYTQTGYNSVVYDAGSFLFQGGCNLNVAPVTSTFRPDIRIGACPPPPGQFVYTWTPATGLSNPNIQNPVANPTVTTNYVVSVTDGSCVATDTVTIRYYSGFLSNLAGNNVGCNGSNDGNLISVPSGGVAPYTFQWSTGRSHTGTSDTLFNLSAGNYSLTLTDANGCTQTDSYMLTVPPPLAVTTAAVDVSCFGYNNGSINTITTGGTAPYSYQWSSGHTTAQLINIGSGSYSLTVTDASGCTISPLPVFIHEPVGISYEVTFTPVSCYQGNDGSATVVITGGGAPPFLFTWYNGFQQANTLISTITGLPAGYVVFHITDQNNCIQTDSVLITSRDSFQITAITLQNARCFNTTDGITLAHVNGDTINYQFNWITPPAVNTALAYARPPGINIVAVTDTAGCTQYAPAIVLSPPPIVLRSFTTDAKCHRACDGSALTVIEAGGTPPFYFQWSNGNTTATPGGLCAGTYLVTVTDNNNCSAYDTISIFQPDSITVNVTINDVLCHGDSNGIITAQAEGGVMPYQYAWTDDRGVLVGDGSNNLTNVAAGRYHLQITDSMGCIAIFHDLEVHSPSLLEVVVQTIPETCPGANDGSVIIQATGGTVPYRYATGQQTGINPVFNGLSPGNYLAMVMDVNNCQATTPYLIQEADSFRILLDPDKIKIAIGEEVRLQPTVIGADTDYLTYHWEPSVGLSCTTCASPLSSPSLTTTYVVTVFDPQGCSTTAQVTVEVENHMVIYVPNAFTPNGDGVNDILRVFGISIKSVIFNVFNRWGEKVFSMETSDLQNGWDGTYRGKMLPPDVFVYYLDATFDDGQKKQLKGSVAILR